MTKVYTQPFRESFGDTKGITGATMEDGTVYRARRGGVMTVDRSDHIAAMKRDPRVAENIAVETFHAQVENGRHCPVCDFSAWPWQMECPRDGTPTEEDENVTSSN
jgi:hypothetical protein